MAVPLVERISKTVIKPSSPTPESLRRYYLSSFDQIEIPDYGNFTFYFVNPGLDISTISQKLQDSLSRILVHYYTFAGVLVGNDYIDCNDSGVEFIQVRIHCSIHEINKKTGINTTVVFPRVDSTPEPGESLVSVQLNHFDCGGIALGVCVHSKLADGSANTAFMYDWAASARNPSHVPSPLLLSDSLFPRREGLQHLPFFESPKVVTRKFVFPEAALQRLRSKAIQLGIQNPSRVEVLTALIYGNALKAAKSTIGRKPSVICQAFNLRPLLGLPLNAMGVMYSFYFSINKQEDGIEVPQLVDQLRKAKIQFQNLPRDKLSYESQMKELEDSLKKLNISDFDFYFFSSYCRLPINKVDFGWGKTKWVTMLPTASQETYFINTSGDISDGIESLVTLEDQKMTAFENSEEMRPFAASDILKWTSNSKL